MVTASEVAKYFLSKDKNRKIFKENVIEINNIKSYEGNIRLNKYLYFAQTVYLAKYGELLFPENIIAYVNGPVVKEVMSQFPVINNNANNEKIVLEEKVRIFLDKIYDALKDASCEELIEISHEDTAWKELSGNTYESPVIDIKKYQKKYEKQYEGLIKVMGI